MADKNITKQWIEYFKDKGIKALAINSQAGSGMKEIVSASQEIIEREV